jgi:hypothetical protein
MSFDKYFNSIQDKASRYYRRLADLDDLIYDKYFNKFRGTTVFEAEVLSNPGEVPAEGSTANTDLFIPLRVRIKDIHDNRLPDPYDAVKGITDEVQKLNEFRKLILSHPVAYPDTKNLMQSAISQGLTQGSIVEVYFAEEGPDFNGRMRGLRYRQVIVAAPARTIPQGLSIGSGFEGGETLAVGDVSWAPKDTSVTIPPALSGSLDSLMPYISNAGFRGKITITSGERTFEAQLNAIMSNLFRNNTWIQNTDEQQGAVEWIQDAYKNGTLTSVVSNLKSENKNKEQTRAKLEEVLKHEDFWRSLTSHDTGDAADIKTRGIDYSEVLLIEQGITAAKGDNGPVKGFKWEKMTTDSARQARKLNKDGVSGEHIHVTFKIQQGE